MYTRAETQRALSRAEGGRPLDVREVAALMAARGDELEQLLDVATRLRDQGLQDAGRPGVITYSRKVFIPLTRLCRDRCHYCTFAKAPGDLDAAFLSPDEVISIARRGAAMECKEALFTLGDRPEDRWPAARAWLESAGYASTLDYLRAMAVLVLEETGLLPHLNPGVMTWDELLRLRAVAPSMGMMLETTSDRLWAERGAPHYGSPDKQPAVRLRVLTDAGRLNIPFTTGLLVGIGETLQERAETLFAIRSAHRASRHVQEVIVQNFRAKPDTAMAAVPDEGHLSYIATIAAARVVLGPSMRIQAPPNLTESDLLNRLLAAGIDDWGGVSPLTADHVNPERPWPRINELEAATREAGTVLRERLTIYPDYVRLGEQWLDPRIATHVRALADVDGLATEGVQPRGIPWQEPEDAVNWNGVVSQSEKFVGRHGDWDAVSESAQALADGTPTRLDASVRSALALAERHPAALLDPQHHDSALALLHADGADLDAVGRLADEIRRSTVGEPVTYVVNRNINFTNICYTGCRFCAFAQRRTDADAYELSLDDIVERAAEAWDLGATEVCLQGGIDPQLPASYYADIVRAIRSSCPALHIHAFSPMEIATGAARAGVPIPDFMAELKEAGLGSLPGTAAEILDDDVRWVLTKGKLPASTWINVVESAHRLGLRTSSTMMFGHVDQPQHWLTHLRVLAGIQDRTQGFTEFVPLPFVHSSAPLYLAGVARPGPTARETRVVHAFARIALHGRIDHVQVSWVKLGAEGVRVMLQSGADDMGGTLMEERISAMAGSRFGTSVRVDELTRWAAGAGRPARQRTTLYDPVDPERAERSMLTGGVLPPPDPPPDGGRRFRHGTGSDLGISPVVGCP
ncbi:MAG TPA: bifunctional FO biosynthesis protein CofGH [Actinomycetes bacterium]|nr:bifunctional FO biosynthesis protein CofGH [Actinomycetes bacterium]